MESVHLKRSKLSKSLPVATFCAKSTQDKTHPASTASPKIHLKKIFSSVATVSENVVTDGEQATKRAKDAATEDTNNNLGIILKETQVRNKTKHVLECLSSSEEFHIVAKQVGGKSSQYVTENLNTSSEEAQIDQNKRSKDVDSVKKKVATKPRLFVTENLQINSHDTRTNQKQVGIKTKNYVSESSSEEMGTVRNQVDLKTRQFVTENLQINSEDTQINKKKKGRNNTKHYVSESFSSSEEINVVKKKVSSKPRRFVTENLQISSQEVQVVQNYEKRVSVSLSSSEEISADAKQVCTKPRQFVTENLQISPEEVQVSAEQVNKAKEYISESLSSSEEKDTVVKQVGTKRRQFVTENVQISPEEAQDSAEQVNKAKDYISESLSSSEEKDTVVKQVGTNHRQFVTENLQISPEEAQDSAEQVNKAKDYISESLSSSDEKDKVVKQVGTKRRQFVMESLQISPEEAQDSAEQVNKAKDYISESLSSSEEKDTVIKQVGTKRRQFVTENLQISPEEAQDSAEPVNKVKDYISESLSSSEEKDKVVKQVGTKRRQFVTENLQIDFQESQITGKKGEKKTRQSVSENPISPQGLLIVAKEIGSKTRQFITEKLNMRSEEGPFENKAKQFVSEKLCSSKKMNTAKMQVDSIQRQFVTENLKIYSGESQSDGKKVRNKTIQTVSMDLCNSEERKVISKPCLPVVENLNSVGVTEALPIDVRNKTQPSLSESLKSASVCTDFKADCTQNENKSFTSLKPCTSRKKSTSFPNDQEIQQDGDKLMSSASETSRLHSEKIHQEKISTQSSSKIFSENVNLEIKNVSVVLMRRPKIEKYLGDRKQDKSMTVEEAEDGRNKDKSKENLIALKKDKCQGNKLETVSRNFSCQVEEINKDKETEITKTLEKSSALRKLEVNFDDTDSKKLNACSRKLSSTSCPGVVELQCNTQREMSRKPSTLENLKKCSIDANKNQNKTITSGNMKVSFDVEAEGDKQKDKSGFIKVSFDDTDSKKLNTCSRKLKISTGVVEFQYNTQREISRKPSTLENLKKCSIDGDKNQNKSTTSGNMKVSSDVETEGDRQKDKSRFTKVSGVEEIQGDKQKEKSTKPTMKIKDLNTKNLQEDKQKDKLSTLSASRSLEKSFDAKKTAKEKQRGSKISQIGRNVEGIEKETYDNMLLSDLNKKKVPNINDKPGKRLGVNDDDESLITKPPPGADHCIPRSDPCTLEILIKEWSSDEEDGTIKPSVIRKEILEKNSSAEDKNRNLNVTTHSQHGHVQTEIVTSPQQSNEKTPKKRKLYSLSHSPDVFPLVNSDDSVRDPMWSPSEHKEKTSKWKKRKLSSIKKSSTNKKPAVRKRQRKKEEVTEQEDVQVQGLSLQRFFSNSLSGRWRNRYMEELAKKSVKKCRGNGTDSVIQRSVYSDVDTDSDSAYSWLNPEKKKKPVRTYEKKRMTIPYKAKRKPIIFKQARKIDLSETFHLQPEVINCDEEHDVTCHDSIFIDLTTKKIKTRRKATKSELQNPDVLNNDESEQVENNPIRKKGKTLHKSDPNENEPDSNIAELQNSNNKKNRSQGKKLQQDNSVVNFVKCKKVLHIGTTENNHDGELQNPIKRKDKSQGKKIQQHKSVRKFVTHPDVLLSDQNEPELQNPIKKKNKSQGKKLQQDKSVGKFDVLRSDESKQVEDIHVEDFVLSDVVASDSEFLPPLIVEEYSVLGNNEDPDMTVSNTRKNNPLCFDNIEVMNVSEPSNKSDMEEKRKRAKATENANPNEEECSMPDPANYTCSQDDFEKFFKQFTDSLNEASLDMSVVMKDTRKKTKKSKNKTLVEDKFTEREEVHASSRLRIADENTLKENRKKRKKCKLLSSFEQEEIGKTCTDSLTNCNLVSKRKASPLRLSPSVNEIVPWSSSTPKSEDDNFALSKEDTVCRKLKQRAKKIHTECGTEKLQDLIERGCVSKTDKDTEMTENSTDFGYTARSPWMVDATKEKGFLANFGAEATCLALEDYNHACWKGVKEREQLVSDYLRNVNSELKNVSRSVMQCDEQAERLEKLASYMKRCFRLQQDCYNEVLQSKSRFEDCSRTFNKNWRRLEKEQLQEMEERHELRQNMRQLFETKRKKREKRNLPT